MKSLDDEMYTINNDSLVQVMKGLQLEDSSDGHKEMVDTMMQAVSQGKVREPCCFVQNLPFSSEGDMMPMLLPCGCTMSACVQRSSSEENVPDLQAVS